MDDRRQIAEGQEKYRRSLNKAQLSDLFGLITGRDNDLTKFDEVAKQLRARQQIDIGAQWVPLKQIVGSVGRYRDFTRSFLPRTNINIERWSKVDAAMNSSVGVPPIELFKIGEVYFVRDGNHRVSVARANGSTHIEAYVIELQTDIPLTLDDFTRDQWIIKAEAKEFLQVTELNHLRPSHGLTLTEPGRYPYLLDHINVHRYFCNLELERQGNPARLTWEEGVISWYDTIYMPIVEAIRSYGVLAHFPGRTEADLYLWIAHHRERLAEHYGLAPLSPDEAVSTFVETHSEIPIERTVKGLRLGLLRALHQDKIPLGMSEAEYLELRTRHDEGEISIIEAEHNSTTSD